MTDYLNVSTTKPASLFALILIFVTCAYFFIVGHTMFLYVLLAAIFFILIRYVGYLYNFTESETVIRRFSQELSRYKYTDIATCNFVESSAKLEVCLKSGKNLFGSSIFLDNDRRKIFNYLKKKGAPINNN